MRCRETTPSDLPHLKRIWKEGFGDTDADIDHFFEEAYPRATGFAAELSGTLCAALYALPLTLTSGGNTTRCAYLYAVATAKAQRGKGMCRALMAFAEDALSKKGFSHALLVPGEASLFGFYETMGYRRQTCHTIGTYALPDARGAAREIDAAQYGALREQLLKDTPHVTYDARWLCYTGASFYALALAGKTGCAAVLGSSVLELLPDARMLPALGAWLSAREVLVRAPGADAAFSIAKPLGAAAFPPDPVYLGFAYE